MNNKRCGIKIYKEMCKGCGLCIINCPKKLITLDGHVNKLGLKTARYKWSKVCSGCSFCAIVCPDCAIEVWR